MHTKLHLQRGELLHDYSLYSKDATNTKKKNTKKHQHYQREVLETITSHRSLSTQEQHILFDEFRHKTQQQLLKKTLDNYKNNVTK